MIVLAIVKDTVLYSRHMLALLSVHLLRLKTLLGNRMEIPCSLPSTILLKLPDSRPFSSSNKKGLSETLEPVFLF
tara:strand:- start:1429 stop:1653 length:225 start_codon:yes stop_codon:yes gene_type:complete